MTTTNKTNQPIIDHPPPTNPTPPIPTYESDDDEDDDDDDEDTVIGTCLHCNAPPPPRSERGHTGSASFTCTPCPASDPKGAADVMSERAAAAAVEGDSEGMMNRVQVSCDDCRSFICDGETYLG